MYNNVDITDVLQRIDDFKHEKSLDKKFELLKQVFSLVQNSNSHQFTNSIDIQKLFDIIVASLDSSSYKLIVTGLEIVPFIVSKYSQNKSLLRVLDATFNKLGDSKPQIREIAHVNMKNIFDNSAEELYSNLDIINLALKKVKATRNKFLKINIISLLSDYLENVAMFDDVNRYSSYIDYFVDFLEDINSEVKENAVRAVTVFYGTLPNSVRNVLKAHDKFNPLKLRHLFPDICDDLLSGASSISSTQPLSNSTSCLDRISSVKNPKKTTSNLPTRNHTTRNTYFTKPTAMSITTASSAAPSSLSEDLLMQCWEVDIFTLASSLKEIIQEISSINECTSNLDNEWEHRVKYLRNLRGIVNKFVGEVDKDELIQMIKPLQQGLEVSIKDLRSQVCKEACVTISYLSYKFDNHFGCIFDHLIHSFIPLFQNSTKIISTGSFACASLCTKYTVEPHVLPVLLNSVKTSKSKEIRKRCQQLVQIVLERWPCQCWSNFNSQLISTIVQGICDADPETRDICRQTFWIVATIMKPLANDIFSKLDTQRKKTLLRCKPESVTEEFHMEPTSPETNGFDQFLARTKMNIKTEPSSGLSGNSKEAPTAKLTKVENPNPLKNFTITDKLPKPKFSLVTEQNNLNEPESIRKSSNISNSANNDKNSQNKIGSLAIPTKLQSFSTQHTPRSAMLLSMRQNKSSLSSVHITPTFVDGNSMTPKDERTNSAIGRPGFTPFTSQNPTLDAGSSRGRMYYSVTNSVSSFNDNFESLTIKPNSRSSYSNDFFSAQDMLADNNEVLLDESQQNTNRASVKTKIINDLTKFFQINKQLQNDHIVILKSCFLDILDNGDDDLQCVDALLNLLTVVLPDQCKILADWISSILPSLLLLYDRHSEPNLTNKIVNIIENIRDTYDSSIQLNIIVSFISTRKLFTTKTKLLVLQLFNIFIVMSCESLEQFWCNKDLIPCISLIVSLAMDLLDFNLRKNAKVTLISLCQIDHKNFVNVLKKIPENKQKFLYNILKAYRKAPIFITENPKDESDTENNDQIKELHF